MPNNYESSFRGSRKEAVAALEDVHKKIAAYGRKGGSFQIQFAYDVLRQICQAITLKGTNYDVYCDIFVNVFTPNIEPKSSPRYWNRFLEMVRYFFYLLNDRKLHQQLDRVYDSFISKPNKLQSAMDYEFLFGAYMQQLLAKKNCSDNLPMIYSHMADLFTDMLRKNHDLNFVYKDLMKTITHNLVPKRLQSVCKFIAVDSKHLRMFEALFKLLAEMREPQIGLEETKKLFMDYMEVFLLLVCIDESAAWSGQQISLLFLKVCRDLGHFKADNAMAYAFSLLYYFVKLVFAQRAIPDFVSLYVEITGKFSKFIERFGEKLKQEPWFMEFVGVMSLLIYEIDYGNAIAFGVACKAQAEIGSIELSNAHLLLIFEFVILASSIKQTKFISLACCKSAGNHVIIWFSRAALKFYTFFVTPWKQFWMEPSTSHETAFRNTFIKIMRRCVEVLETTGCTDSFAADIQLFHASICKLLAKITTISQVRLAVSLMETIASVQHKFTPQIWIQLLSRLRQATYATKDNKMITETHANQIAFMVKLLACDYQAILHQVGIFYTTEHVVVRDMCLLEILQLSKSSLKPILATKEKHQLHSIEAQIVLKYQKSNLRLQESLLKFSQTDLDYILIARENNQLHTHEKVQRILKSLQLKSKQQALKRVEKLTLAHALTISVSEQVEKAKKLFDYPLKDFIEDTLDTLLLREQIKRIDVRCELNVIKMAMEAVYLFKAFYSTADSEPITANDFVLDWEAVMADISLLARLLQLRGYLEDGCQAWLILYRIATFLQDSHNTLRSLAFLCEHAVYFEDKAEINLAEEVNKHTSVILNSLHIIHTLLPRRQNYVLLCLCQLAHFNARSGNFIYANLLLKLVEHKRNQLPERREKFDFVLGSLQAVKFRILWKFKDENRSSSTDSICILRQIENTFNRFRSFVQITSEDSWNYMILLFGLMREFAECTVNRLCDNIVKSFYISILKAALETGAALRVVQSLTSWALANLQSECVDKAQIKMKIIEIFLGEKNAASLSEAKSPTLLVKEQYKVASLEDGLYGPLLSVQMNAGMEPIRRVAQINLSPAMKDKLRLTVTPDNRGIQRYIGNNASSLLSGNSLLQWTYLSVGYINARLFYLVEDFSPLEEFYEQSLKWCRHNKNDFMMLSFQNLQLLGMEHYVNFLRANGKFNQAIECVEAALALSSKAARNVDKVYSINLQLQKQATKKQMLQVAKQNHRDSLTRLRRALEFRLSPEEEKQPNKENIKSVGRSTRVSKKPDHNIKALTKKPETKEAEHETAQKIKYLAPETTVWDRNEGESPTVIINAEWSGQNPISKNMPTEKATTTQASNAKTTDCRPTRVRKDKQPKTASQEHEDLRKIKLLHRRAFIASPKASDLKKRKASTEQKTKQSNKENIAMEIPAQTMQNNHDHEINSNRRRREAKIDDLVDKMQSLHFDKRMNDVIVITDDETEEGSSTTRRAAATAATARICRSGKSSEKVVATIITKTRAQSKKTESDKLVLTSKDQTFIQTRTRRRET